MNGHALLSPSAAHRWMHCTRSARFEANFPDRSSKAANEGTLAHAMGELKLRRLVIGSLDSASYNAKLAELKNDPLYAPEMNRYTDDYVAFVEETMMSYPTKPYIAVEQKLALDHWIVAGSGTGDCIIIGGGVLDIIDLKYGQSPKGRVDAHDNPQIRLYALGTLARYGMIFPVDTIHMTIFQPRLDSISSETISRAELESWGEQCKALAAKAYAGEGNFTPGSWCQFCKGKGACKAYADQHLSLSGMQTPVGAMTPEQIGAALEKGQNLAAWLSGVQEYALSALLDGGSIPGWKAVEGRSIRKFADADKALDMLLAAGYEKALLYDWKPKTLSQLEGIVGKKDFAAILGPQIVKPKGAPALVPASDKREPYRELDAKDVFKPID